MTLRTHKKKNFTTISNELIQDTSMSWEARGLMSYLLSKPDGWTVQKEHLVSQSPNAKRDKVKAILSELQDAGYIYRWRERRPNGTFVWRSEIFEDKADRAEWEDNHDGFSDVGHDGKSTTGSTTTGSTTIGSAIDGQGVDITNTDSTKTELTKTESTKKEREKERAIENFEGEVFEAEFWDEQEEFNPVNSQEFLGTEIDRDYRDREKNVPAGAAASSTPTADVSGLAKIQPVDALAQRFRCKSSADSDYARFKDVYQRLCNIVGANYGDHGKAQQAWQAMKDEFGGLPDRFWDGLEAFRKLSISDFGRKGSVILPGAAKWLNQQEWINALDREQIQREAAAAGVDMQASPATLRKQQEHEEFRAMWQQAKAQIARRNQQPQGA